MYLGVEDTGNPNLVTADSFSDLSEGDSCERGGAEG